MSGFLARRDLALHQSEGEICLYFYDKDNNYQDDENENGCDGNGMVGNVTMAGHGKRLLLNVVAVCVCVCVCDWNCKTWGRYQSWKQTFV